MSTVTLSWTNPTTRTDGSTLAANDIAGIHILDTASPGEPIGIVAGAGTTFTTGVLSAGVHNFTAVVIDTAGDDSAPSNVLSETITIAPPAAISNLSGTINP